MNDTGERTMTHLAPTLRIASGLALTVAGLAMLVLPGPGLLTLVAAANVLARDIPAVGRWVAPVNARLQGLRRALPALGAQAAAA